MIKFFRKIRQRLLIENRFTKYLIYAIGEIVLVVIGILIALDINNRNELKKNDLDIRSSLSEIQNNLLEDIEKSQLNVNFYFKTDSIKNKMLREVWTYDDYKKGKVGQLGRVFYPFVINTSGYENLMRQFEKIPSKYKPILIDLKTLYIDLNAANKISNERIRSTVYANHDYLWNQDWKLYSITNSEVSKEEMDYFLYSDEYKKRALKFMQDNEIVFRDSQRFRVKAIETYLKIDSLFNIKERELPRDLLGLIVPSEFEDLLGTYQLVNYPLAVKLFIKNNKLYSEDNDGIVYRHWKINDELFMYMYDRYPLIWKFKQNTQDNIGIEFLNTEWKFEKTD